MIDGLPPIPATALPAGVDRDTYRAALGFEQVLLGELVSEMTKSTPSLSEGPRADAVTDAMTASLAAAGGIGLAPQLYQTLQRTAR